MIARRTILTIVCWSVFCLPLTGCTSLSYYGQAIAGQTEVFVKQKPIDELLGMAELDEATRSRLQLVRELRRFSTEQLGLPDNASYTRYADLQRRFVVWNIVATPALSLEPKQWCFLVVGCLPYRGYFNEQDARDEQRKLQAQGFDVFLGGVAAYSTLGWFDDPVLNTMLNWSETYLAKVMFHELAHQQLYVRDDTEFNESYADTVAGIGVQRWLESRQDPAALLAFLAEEDRDRQFVELIMKYRHRLERLFASELDESRMRAEKKRLYGQLTDEYQTLKKSWNEDSYDNWFNRDLNNARLASVVTYRKHTENMLAIYEKLDKNLVSFYDILSLISKCARDRRQQLLEAQSIPSEC